MFHTLISLLTGLLGHLTGDPVHRISALAIKAVMEAGAALEQHGASDQLVELINRVDALLIVGRATTEQEWIELKALADKQIELCKRNPVSPAPVQASDTPTQNPAS